LAKKLAQKKNEIMKKGGFTIGLATQFLSCKKHLQFIVFIAMSANKQVT